MEVEQPGKRGTCHACLGLYDAEQDRLVRIIRTEGSAGQHWFHRTCVINNLAEYRSYRDVPYFKITEKVWEEQEQRFRMYYERVDFSAFSEDGEKIINEKKWEQLILYVPKFECPNDSCLNISPLNISPLLGP